jgi:AraC family transcriptional regulator of adaptative response/methylated-DNA-[protein]-cysteine methyltransferase
MVKTDAANTEIRFAIVKCTLGSVLVAMSTRGVCAIYLGDDSNALTCNLQDKFPNALLIESDKNFEHIIAKIIGFIEEPSLQFELPLDIQGTAFQQRVWLALKNIPIGSTASYSDIAKKIGSPSSVRAVARACATNSLALAIPCHRVVRNDGALSGYRWGIERKQQLLNREFKHQQ